MLNIHFVGDLLLQHDNSYYRMSSWNALTLQQLHADDQNKCFDLL